jgi:hypothetical protein
VDFKLFPKLLIDRVSPLTDKVTSESQATFIKGRNILEGVVVLHEVIHELKRSRRKGVIFKIDFKKAYDKVRWDFVGEVMRSKRFPNKWVKQTMNTIHGGKVCININGEMTHFLTHIRSLGREIPYPLLCLTWWLKCYPLSRGRLQDRGRSGVC